MFVLALVLGLATVFVIDPLDPSTVCTPFCLGIILTALSLRQGTALVVAVSVLYSLLTTYALVEAHRYHEMRGDVGPHPYFWLFQRMGLFIVLCALASYLTYYRTETEQNLTRLRTVLGRLPAPVILSDVSGNIVYANDAITTILHQPPSDLVGRRYVDVLSTEPMEGKSIPTYLERFDADTNGIFEVETSPFGHGNKFNAQIMCLGTEANRVMITVLQNTEVASTGLASLDPPLPTNFTSQPQKL